LSHPLSSQDEIVNATSFDNIMDKDASIFFNISMFGFQLQKKFLGFWIVFEKYGKESHNMFFLDVQP
jgi:hypothetical protein